MALGEAISIIEFYRFIMSIISVLPRRSVFDFDVGRAGFGVARVRRPPSRAIPEHLN